jgi:hypothetical protein
VDRWNPIRTSAIQSRSRPMKRELRGKTLRSDQRSAGRFREVGGVLLRSTSLAKGGTSKKGPSTHLYKVQTRSKSTNFANGPRNSGDEES